MANLKHIRRRITSVKSTQKITRAMKLVAAAKFARANAAVVSARPYGKAFDSMVARLVAAAGEEFKSPLLEDRPEKKALMIVLATDRGFCGSLNANMFKEILNFISDRRKEGVELELLPLGKRARLFCNKLSYETIGFREKVLEKPSYSLAFEIAGDLNERFSRGEYDRVYIGYMEFKSALAQFPSVKQVLPVGKVEDQGEGIDQVDTANLLIEPDASSVLSGLLKKSVANSLFRAMLEGAASEHGARMTAMDSATNNATEVIKKLTIEYNRARQAAITTELIEITSGAEAL